MSESFSSLFKPRIFVSKDLSDLSNKAADYIAGVFRPGLFHFVLTGGSTPKTLYYILSERKLSWENVHFFWGDERCVPPDHPDSNFLMAQEALLKKIPAEEDHIHRMKGEIEPATAASEYEAQLRMVFAGNAVPSFDLVLLGMGEDGHVASLFPETAALKVQDRLVVDNYVEKLQKMRLTMTFPLLNQAARILFMVSGEPKAFALQQVLEGEVDPVNYPAQCIKPIKGELLFYVDEAAASLLKRP